MPGSGCRIITIIIFILIPILIQILILVLILTLILILILIIILKLLSSHDELGTCGTSLVFPKQAVETVCIRASLLPC